MDRDYIWEGEYGRRSHLIPVFQQLLREQDASSLQMLSLFVNNNPYNLEFFIAVSYDSVLDRGIQISRLPLFLQDIKCLMREERTIYQVAQQIASALRPS